MSWRQAARGGGFRTGGVCASCFAPSIGGVKQAREVTVLVVDELKHVWGKEKGCVSSSGAGAGPVQGTIHLPTLLYMCKQCYPREPLLPDTQPFLGYL